MLQAWMIATAVTLLEPDHVLVGGGIAEMDGYPFDKLDHTVRAHLQHPTPAYTLRISQASLDHEGALQGALSLIDLYSQKPPSNQA